jgi:hypothetical protein
VRSGLVIFETEDRYPKSETRVGYIGPIEVRILFNVNWQGYSVTDNTHPLLFFFFFFFFEGESIINCS